jgi:hypothetical protein
MRVSALDERSILGHLEELAHRLGIELRYEPIQGETSFPGGGYCRIGGKQVIILQKGARLKDQVNIMVRALKRFDLSRIYVRPALRDLLESGGNADWDVLAGG